MGVVFDITVGILCSIPAAVVRDDSTVVADIVPNLGNSGAYGLFCSSGDRHERLIVSACIFTLLFSFV